MNITPLDMDRVKELRMRGLYKEADKMLDEYHKHIEQERLNDKRQLRNVAYLKEKISKARDTHTRKQEKAT